MIAKANESIKGLVNAKGLSGNQAGVALITVLFVFAIASVLAISIATASFYSTRLTGNHLDRTQLHNYLSAGEALAEVLLKDDWAHDKEANEFIDFAEEDWGKQLHSFSYSEGQVSLKINDLQGRFNLNSVVKNGKKNDIGYDRFRLLLSGLNIDVTIANKLLDWIDDNQSTTGSGAEDIVYLGVEAPYRTGDWRMLSVSELRLLEGLDVDDYLKLLPHVSVLSSDQGINVNTASAEVLRSLSSKLSAAASEQLVETLKRSPIKSPDDLKKLDELFGIEIKTNGLSAFSEYYEVAIEATYLGKNKRMLSIVQRSQDDGSVRVEARNFGIPFKSKKYTDK